MTNEFNIHAEPVAPTIGFVTHAGRADGKTAEHSAWLQDMEERTARSAEFVAKRRQLNEEASKPTDVVTELDAALSALEAGAIDFEQSYGKPNEPLIAAKSELGRLRNELNAAEDRLAQIEARRDSVTRLQQSVMHAEGALNGLLRAAEEKALRKLVAKKFGWEAPMHKVSRETLNELALDISVQSLRRFAIQQHRGTTNDVAVLQQRMEQVGETLVALRDYLDALTAQ